MKSLTAILLLLLVGFLSFQPAINSGQSWHAGKMNDKKSCMNCKKHCDKEKNDENNRDCNNCNPFMACVYGNFFENTRVFTGLDHPTLSVQKNSLSDEKVKSTYIADCWHPPESFSM